MNRVVAVSGGVDSVVLLDVLARGDDRLVVAHVDHGIRGQESAADARFVRGLAERYGLPYVETQLELKSDASEDTARRGRYAFLRKQAEEFDATIVTAHHQDDLIGSIAINLIRGTGWRGLTVLSRAGVERPLLGWNKSRIYEYALTHRLEWVEDASNQSDVYLRNRLRPQLQNLSTKKVRRLLELRQTQRQLRRDIEREIVRLLAMFGTHRHAYIQIEPAVAIELLRTQYQLTHPAAERLLGAIKTARPGTRHDVGDARRVRMTRDSFVVESDQG